MLELGWYALNISPTYIKADVLLLVRLSVNERQDLQPLLPWHMPLRNFRRSDPSFPRKHGLRPRKRLRASHLQRWRLQQLLFYAQLPAIGRFAVLRHLEHVELYVFCL